MGHAILEHIYIKWLKGHSLTICICGETNSGKTITGLTIANYLMRRRYGREFKPSGHVFVSLEEFILSFFKMSGEVIIIDEAKKHLDSRRWWTDFNKFFGDIIATQRYKNNLYIVILPLAKTLSREHRDMIDVILEMKRQGLASCYIVKRHWSEIQHFEIWKWWVGDMIVKMPPEHIVKEYQAFEKNSKQQIYLDMVADIIKDRRCPCGSKVKFTELECPKCGERVGQEYLNTLIDKKLKGGKSD